MSEGKSRVALQSGSVSVDADPAVLARLFHDLSTNREFRRAFEQDPAPFLAECGIQVSDDVRKKINPAMIAEAIQSAGGGSEVAAIAAPGVAPAIRVGTSPGTQPGVRVGVSVATGSAVFTTRPKSLEEMSFTEALKTRDL